MSRLSKQLVTNGRQLADCRGAALRADVQGLSLALVLAACLFSASAAEEKPNRPFDRPKTPHGGAVAPGEYPLTDEQLNQLLDLVRSWRPQFGRKLAQLRETDPGEFRRALHRLASREPIRHLIHLRQTDTETFNLAVKEFRLQDEVGRMAAAIRQSKDSDTTEAQEQLRARLRELLAVRLQLRQRELQHLQQRLEKLQQQLKRQQETQDKQIEDQFQKLTRPQPATSPVSSPQN